LSLEDESQQDVSQQDEAAFEMGNFDDIEVDDDNEDRFKQGDFHKFQKQMELEDDGEVCVADNSAMSNSPRDVLGLLESEHILESQTDDLEDDYGVRINSPYRPQQKSEKFSSTVSPQKAHDHFTEKDPSDQ
jgi:hypothetical protein